MHAAAVACPSCGRPNAMLAPAQERPSSWLSFSGRISRKTYWLHYGVPLWVISTLGAIFDDAANAGGVISGLVTLLVLVPNLAASAKRLHDRGRSGWFLFIVLIPIIGFIWYLIEVGFLRGTRGPNRYGTDPVFAGQFPQMPAAAR